VGKALRDAWTELRGGLASVLELPPKPLELELDKPLAPSAAPHQHLWSQPGAGAFQALAAAFPDRTQWAYPEPAPGEGTAEGPAVRYLGSFEETYLLAEVRAEKEPELWIVDQHVAHERILYERLFLRRHAPAVQPLLPPRVVQLGPEAISRLTPFMEEFALAGLEVELFGGDALVVRGLPDFLSDRDPQSLVEDLLSRLDGGGRIELDDFRKELNAELACRAAIKKHHILPADLALRLILDLMACEVPHTCPHGRPVIKKLTLGERDRSFGRRV